MIYSCHHMIYCSTVTCAILFCYGSNQDLLIIEIKISKMQKRTKIIRPFHDMCPTVVENHLKYTWGSRMTKMPTDMEKQLKTKTNVHINVKVTKDVLQKHHVFWVISLLNKKIRCSCKTSMVIMLYHAKSQILRIVNGKIIRNWDTRWDWDHIYGKERKKGKYQNRR